MTRRLLWAVALLCASAHAQVQSIIQPHITYVDGSGAPCAGCSLFSFAAGTTTPQPTFTDTSGSVQNTNPVILDAAGGASIAVSTSAYKFILVDAGGTTLWSVDNVISPFPGNSGPFLPLAGGTLTGPAIGTVFQATSNNIFAGEGLSLQWNSAGGRGEGDFVNYRGGGVGGFNWYDLTDGTSASVPIMTLSTTGILNVLAGLQINGVPLAASNLSNGVSGTGAVCLASGSACAVSGNAITALTGDVTAAGPGSAAATLATVGTGAGSCTNCNITFDAKGRETAYTAGSALPIVRSGHAAGCTTATGDGQLCTTTITWAQGPFSDINYDFSCLGLSPVTSGSTSNPAEILLLNGQNKTTAGVDAITASHGSGQGASFGTITCIAIHN
jgi:hypothetical protein